MQYLKLVLALMRIGFVGLVFPTWFLIKATILYLDGEPWQALGLAFVAIALVVSVIIAPGVKMTTVCKIEEV